MSIVLVVMGVLIGIGLPIARVYIDNSMRVEDKALIKELRKVLVGYGMSRGGYPVPDAGNVLPTTSVGVTGLNSYNNNIRYYANTLLTEAATANNFTTLCDTAKSILDGTTVSTEPAICNDISNISANCTNSTVMAFVIVSPGKNRAMEHENGDGDNVFENPTKTPSEQYDYDDVVASYGLAELVNECQSL